MIVIACIHPWNLVLAKAFKKRYKDVHIISQPSTLTPSKMKRLNPRYIFFPHWSWIIPKEIFEKYECIVFHMTDLPYGRGGSPLQNLIVRKHRSTKISAIRVVKQLDAGDVYLKVPLSLKGAAEEIFTRAAGIIFKKMIPAILKRRFTPKPQKGKVTIFKRRQPQDGSLEKLTKLEDIYDYIRMLDAPGYPKAFIKFSNTVFEFSKVEFKKDHLLANVQIRNVL